MIISAENPKSNDGILPSKAMWRQQDVVITRSDTIMSQKYSILKFRWLAILLVALFVSACANIGHPNGGPYDETPPKYVSSKPAMNQLNYKGKKIEILFDEFISIDNPNENVIITPPQKQNPVIQPIGKKVKVELKDSLIENTTYTIDFTSSIVDFNEKNALENFSFAFSTGDVIDTLQISGVVINAEDIEPVQKMMVGIHRDLSDTAFTKTTFLRTSKTDDRGRFIIKNVALDSYRVFALEDKNRNFAYDKNNDEGLAFLDSIIIPTCERVMVADTVWRDSITVDTVSMVERTKFYPNDLVLWFFKDSIAPRQRMLRPERTKEHIFTLKFNATMDTFPKPVPLNFETADSVWYITQKGDSRESFSINYWILDSMIYTIDTLQMEVTYWKNNDSIPELLELRSDTVSIVYKEPPKSKKDTKPKTPPKVKRSETSSSDSVQANPDVVPAIPLQLNISPSGAINPYDIITVLTNEPVMDVRKDFFKMEMAVDTLWEAVDFDFEIDSTRAMAYLIKRPFKYEEQYRITIDSAMLISVYNHSNNPVNAQLTVKSDKDYGHCKVNITGIPFVRYDLAENRQNLPSEGDSAVVAIQAIPLEGDTTVVATQAIPLEGDTTAVVSQNLSSDSVSYRVMPAFIELLNNSGAPVRKAVVENGVALFRDLLPDKYYARIILDANGNGIWDAGNYEERRQPELVYYYLSQFEVPLNWMHEEDWNISESKLGQKPFELVKNKPKEEMQKKRDYKEENKPRKGTGTTPSIGGLKF